MVVYAKKVFYLHVYVHHMCAWCLMRPEEVVGSPKLELAVSCHADAGT